MAAPSYSAIRKYAMQLQRVSRAARDAFLEQAAEVDLSDPEKAADELKRIGRAVLDRFGIGARELGAQWYDFCHSLEIGEGYTAIVGEVSRYSLESDFDALVAKAVAGEIAPEELISLLGGTVTNQTQREARNVIMENLVNERQMAEERGDYEISTKMRYVRVPQSGSCAFCVLLASRTLYIEPMNFQLYKNARTAGTRESDGHKFHDDCKCQIVPFADAKSIPGYGKTLAEYDSKYRNADNLYKSVHKGNGAYPEELQERIDQAKAEHAAAFARGETSRKWARINEETIIMRYQNPELR